MYRPERKGKERKKERKREAKSQSRFIMQHVPSRDRISLETKGMIILFKYLYKMGRHRKTNKSF